MESIPRGSGTLRPKTPKGRTSKKRFKFPSFKKKSKTSGWSGEFTIYNFFNPANNTISSNGVQVQGTTRIIFNRRTKQAVLDAVNQAATQFRMIPWREGRSRVNETIITYGLPRDMEAIYPSFMGIGVINPIKDPPIQHISFIGKPQISIADFFPLLQSRVDSFAIASPQLAE